MRYEIGDRRYEILDTVLAGFCQQTNKLEFSGFAELTIDN